MPVKLAGQEFSPPLGGGGGSGEGALGKSVAQPDLRPRRVSSSNLGGRVWSVSVLFALPPEGLVSDCQAELHVEHAMGSGGRSKTCSLVDRRPERWDFCTNNPGGGKP